MNNLRSNFRYWRFKDKEMNVRTIRKFFILDFEATCDLHGTLKPQEIIEFPCLKVDASTFNVEVVFHRYVRPKINRILTPFCVDLTGIMQSMVDDEPEFSVVLEDFRNWLKINFDSSPLGEAIFVTCGNWDLKKMLPEQCQLYNLDVPEQMTSWINLKMAFSRATGYWPKSLSDMFRYLNRPLLGKLHSGINDCQNMLIIMKELHKMGYIFGETSNPNSSDDIL